MTLSVAHLLEIDAGLGLLLALVGVEGDGCQDKVRPMGRLWTQQEGSHRASRSRSRGLVQEP